MLIEIATELQDCPLSNRPLIFPHISSTVRSCIETKFFYQLHNAVIQSYKREVHVLKTHIYMAYRAVLTHTCIFLIFFVNYAFGLWIPSFTKEIYTIYIRMSKLLLMFLPVIGRPAAVVTKCSTLPPPGFQYKSVRQSLLIQFKKRGRKNKFGWILSIFWLFVVQKFGILTFQSFFNYPII